MLSLTEQRIVPLPFFDFCGVPKNIFDFFRQSATWFEAQSDYIDPYRGAAYYFKPLSKVRQVRGLLEQIEANVTWALQGPAYVILLLASIITGVWMMSAVLILLIIADAWTQWSLTHILLSSHVNCEQISK